MIKFRNFKFVSIYCKQLGKHGYVTLVKFELPKRTSIGTMQIFMVMSYYTVLN